MDKIGKADLIGCNQGWDCETVIEHHLDVYDLRATVKHTQDDYSALMGGTIARFESGKPSPFYTWTPNWTVSKIAIGKNVVWPGVPVASLPHDPNAKTKRDSLPDCLQNPCDTGFGVNDIRIVANVKFLVANPAAETLLDLVEIPLEDIAAQNLRLFKGEDDADDIRRAEEWIEAVRNLVDE